ncbi:reverse transcriptase [Tanacetum coccineum]
MVNIRSTDNGGSSQRGMLTGSTTVESRLTSMMNLITRLTESVTTLENKVNSGEGTSQRREHLGGQIGGNNGGSYGRLTKVEFPKFDGEDVQGWLYRVNKFFKMDRIIKKRFESVFEDPLVELKNLKQTTNVQVYQDSFEELLNKVELSKSYAVSLFIRGLREDIAYAVRMFRPTSPIDVFCLSKLQEANNSVSKSKHAPVLVNPKTNVMTASIEHRTPQIQTLLDNFPTVFESPKELPPLRSHDHTIPLLPNITPINIRPSKYLPNHKDAIELMVKELLEAGLIRDSQSSFSSPIVMVKKKDVSWRMYVNYRQLNKHIVKNKFPISVIEELLDELNGSKMVYKVEYLGHFIIADGVVTDPSKIQAMVDWPVPYIVKQLRGFLGLTRHYMRFVRHYALISKPLTRLLNKNAFEWDKAAQIAFTELKQAMTQAPVLALPNFQKTCVVDTDASGLGIGVKIKDIYEQESAAEEKIQQLKNETYIGDKYTWEGLSKYAHFMALSHPYTTSSAAQVFLDSVYKLHGLTNLIVSDRDVVFLTGESVVEIVDRTLQARETAIEMLKFHLKRAQDRMKVYDDRKRSEREFELGM